LKKLKNFFALFSFQTQNLPIITMSVKLPTALQPSIKRAKLAIRSFIQNPTEDKRKIAELEIANADKISKGKGRKNWKNEILIIPHYTLCFNSWYAETNSTQWSIDKMPDWAKNGENEPNIGTNIDGNSYTKAPKSQRD